MRNQAPQGLADEKTLFLPANLAWYKAWSAPSISCSAVQFYRVRWLMSPGSSIRSRRLLYGGSQVFDCEAQLLRHMHDTRLVGVREYDAELLSAVSAGEIIASADGAL